MAWLYSEENVYLCAQLLEEKNNNYIQSSLNVLEFYLVVYMVQYLLFQSKLKYMPELCDFLVDTTEMSQKWQMGSTVAGCSKHTTCQ